MSGKTSAIRLFREALRVLTGLTVILACTATPIIYVSGAPVNLFDLGLGVRTLGMGEAFVAVADDEAATLYNPAGLAYLQRFRISSSYESRFGASSYISALGALPHLGAGLALFDFGSVEQRDAQDEVVGTFGYLQFGLLGSGGLKMSELPLAFTRGMSGVALGGQLRLVGENTLGGGGVGTALSWGFLLTAEQPALLPVREFRAGLLLGNLPGIGISGPLRVKTGVAARPFPDLLVALDLGLPFEFHAGTEFSVPMPVSSLGAAVRGGFFFRGSVLSFTAGLGLSVSALRFDYAFISHSTLPGSHRLALSWGF